jgi:hypothetical protein
MLAALRAMLGIDSAYSVCFLLIDPVVFASRADLLSYTGSRVGGYIHEQFGEWSGPRPVSA